MFTNETVVCQFDNFTVHVRRPLNRRYDPIYTTATIKNPPKMMIWEGILSNGHVGSSSFLRKQ